MFDRGETRSSDKMGAGAMLEELRATHPGVYALPSETEIQQAITRFNAGRGKQGASAAASSQKRKRTRFPQRAAEWLKDLIERNADIKPADALTAFKEHAIAAKWDADEIPGDAAVKSKVSSVKQGNKKRASNDTL
jgi:hypothetical protein